MNNIQLTSEKSNLSLRWMARFLSIVVSAMFLLIMVLAITNEDKPTATAVPVIILLAMTIMECLAAWHWEKAGGIALMVGAIFLFAAAYSSSLASGLGSISLLPALIYGVPFLVIGILFWMSSQKTFQKLN